MRAGEDITIDQYSPLSHKLPLDPRRPQILAPTWVPDTEHRRLNAYKVRAAYLENIARIFGGGTLTPDDLAKRREYGDAGLLVQRTVAGVLGDQVQIVVDGADDDLPELPDLPPQPEDPGAEASDIDRRVHATRMARWQADAEQVVAQWEADWAEQPGLIERQEWLRSWAEDEFYVGKVVECEHDIVGLADGVKVFGWSHAQQRVTVDVYDPGFYFPVLVDDERGYPTKIHLAWEFERTEGTTTRRFVRRLTWHLTAIPLATDPDTGLPAVDLAEDGTPFGVMQEGDRWNETTGLIERVYPWAPEEPSSTTCLFTDATWEIKDIGPRKVDDFAPEGADYAITEDGQIARDLDLRRDFISVVHTPNTPSTREHFGRSILDLVAQLLDDLHAADTDVRLVSELAAGPMVAAFGTAVAQIVGYQPGLVVNVPNVDGRVDVLDLTQGLEELRNGRKDLRELMSVNASVPAEVLGVRNQEGQAPSGVSLALRFGPFKQLVELLRLTRLPKYQLELKMVQRIAQAGGVLEPGENPVARLVLGSYLPSDIAETVRAVVELLTQHGISRLTALRLLVDAGVEIGDLAEELDRINAEDTAAAVQVADATGSEAAAAERLGIEIPESAAPAAVAPPEITLPGAGAPPPEPPA